MALRLNRRLLYEWEVEFLHSLSDRVFDYGRELTDGQLSTLERLIDDVGRRQLVTARRL